MSTAPRILGGRYEVGELIGRGGMAEVHAGHDTRLGRSVAIKILRSDLARDPSFLQRFRREAQSSAGLNHANIVAVYDSGEDTFVEAGGGTVDIPYIVMEYVDGQTLREILNDEKKLSSDEACRVTMGILSALEYSHSKGIVHRDIKPGNVMVTRGGNVKVMDFGIARALADVGATMTSAQAVVRTARYLSPEQAQGESVDPRTDLYSAGCVLFELLTGRAPFVGEPVSLVYQHIGEQPQPPSLYEHSVSPELDAVVLHSLEKKRDARYQSAGEFRSDVLAARSGQEISAAALASTQAAGDSTEVVNYTRRGAALAAADHTAELDERHEPKRSRGGLWALAVIAALAAILGIGYLFMNPSGTTDQVTVTKVEGMTYDQAFSTLSQDFTVERKETSSDQSEGTVVDGPGLREGARRRGRLGRDSAPDPHLRRYRRRPHQGLLGEEGRQRRRLGQGCRDQPQGRFDARCEQRDHALPEQRQGHRARPRRQDPGRGDAGALQGAPVDQRDLRAHGRRDQAGQGHLRARSGQEGGQRHGRGRRGRPEARGHRHGDALTDVDTVLLVVELQLLEQFHLLEHQAEFAEFAEFAE